MEREGQDPAGPEERGDAFDDLFDDLDRFFAPDPQARRRRAEEEESRPEQQAGSEEPSRLDEATGGEAEELLPSDWRPDIESLTTGDERPEDETSGIEPEEREEEAPASAPAAPSEPPTAEMTGEEWSRLRDVLGEGEGEEAGDVLGDEAETPETTADESMFGYDEEPTDRPEWLEPGGGHELTLDDMRKAPPEYRDLPGPRDESVAPEEQEPTVEPSDEPVTSGAEELEPTYADAEEPASAEAEWPEPSIAEVEAAADQLAEEFRDAEQPSQVEADLLSDLDEPSGPRTVRVGAPESLTGPTWEEPTSRPLMTETAPPQAPGPARNLSAAVITAAVLAFVALIALLIAKAAFVVVAGGAVLLGQAELYATMRRKGHQPATALGLVIGGFMMAGAYRKGEPAIAFFVVLGAFLAFLWYMAAPLKARENLINNVGSTMLGVLYGPALACYVFLLLAQPDSGRALMLTVIGLTFWYDIWAFIFGSFWGSRPLAPTISPRKSWEGLAGATAVTFISSLAVIPSVLDYFSVTQAIGLFIVIAVFAPMGDLIESLIKRDLGVKDMGSLLPGHGGVFDRIDSVLLVAPAAFYYIRLVF